MVRLKEFIFITIWIASAFSQNKHDCPKRCNCFSTVVNCANQNFHALPPLPTWTELLYISDNPLETFSAQSPSMIITPNNLTSIDFTRTNLRYVDPNVLSTLFNDVHFIQRSLTKLKFDENELIQFPMINDANNLRSLSLSSNKLNYESVERIDIFATYPQIEFLDLSYNSIKMVPKHFLSSSSRTNITLTHLVLNNNGIETIEEDAFELFINLKILKLSKNNIAIVSKSWLGQFRNLKELDLNYNRINKIDILAFEGLESLQILKMRRNKLDDLSDGSFWGLSKLQRLHLDHNSISEISEGWMYGLESLKELTLKHNSIINIGDNTWSSAHSLIEVNLNFNKLQHIRKKTFEKLNSLQILKLSNNNISYVDERAFRSLKNLETLDLSYNKLSWTIESSNGFYGLGLLKELRLDYNQIRLIYKHTFSGLTSLTMLNLTSNPISSIQKDSFDWFKNLNNLCLENVDLFCDCTMKWLYEWLQTSEIRRNFAQFIKCKHPKELSIKTSNSFLDIDPSEFKCQNFLKPYLIEDFKNITKPIVAIKNQDITFNCKVATGSDDEIIFKWFKDNQIINHDRAILHTISQAYSDNVTHYTSVLNLIDIQDEDQGVYHCMASNSYGSVYSHKFLVNVYITPYFIKRPHNVTVKIGHTAKLECAAKGQPSPIISWQKDGGDNFPAAMERRMHVMPADHVFFIVEVKKSDMGSYSCHATNGAGSIISTAFLNVIEIPSFVRKMIDKKATIGSTASLECMAAGIPIPQITWFKDGRLLLPTERHFFTAEGQLLIIVKLKSSDQGVYSCNISNTYGTVHDSSYLEIISNSDKNSEDILILFFSVIRAHAFIVIIIILCVVFTSMAWIIVICYIRQRHKLYMKERSTENFQSNNNFDINRNEYLISKQHPSHPTPTMEKDSDFNSETSSALDTGIEESCQSYEEEHELTNVINHSREYHSLPRNNITTYNTQLPISYSYSLLLQKQLTKSDQFSNRAQLFYIPRNGKTSVLSSKEKKLLVKKQKHQQMMNIRKYTTNINDGLETTIQMINNDNEPHQMMKAFSINDIASTSNRRHHSYSSHYY